MTRTGIAAESFSACAITREWSATCSSVSGPYRCWLPVTNHTSNCLRSIISACLSYSVLRSCRTIRAPATYTTADALIACIHGCNGDGAWQHLRRDPVGRARLQRIPDGAGEILRHHLRLDRSREDRVRAIRVQGVHPDCP